MRAGHRQWHESRRSVGLDSRISDARPDQPPRRRHATEGRVDASSENVDQANLPTAGWMMRSDSAPRRMTARHGLWPRLVIAAIFVGALVAFFAFGGNDYLRLDAVKR